MPLPRSTNLPCREHAPRMRASESAPTSPDTKLRYAGRSSRSMSRDRRYLCGTFAVARAAAAAASQAATAAFAPSMRRGAQGLASVTA